MLPVQVIAQQWEFTYRYPTYGGVETAHLELPVDQQVEFHVTSLDVIHSFWAPRIGVKADANPGVDNIAFTEPTRRTALRNPLQRALRALARLHVRHRPGGQRRQASATGSTNRRRSSQPADKVLPKYSTHYFPEPERRAG